MIKLLIILIPLILFSNLTVGQTNMITAKVDSLKYLKLQPFLCNSVYWRVVAIGKDAIPYLIDRLDDTTHTQISLTCKSTNVKFGDICFEALKEILNIPIFYVTHRQFDVFDPNGCQLGVYNYLNNNRQEFKSQISVYYSKNKKEIKFIKYSKEYNNDCKDINKIFGYYDIDSSFLERKK